MTTSRKIKWPEGKKFAFTIVDDTDHASVERVQPLYQLLEELNMQTTKTVWTLPIDSSEHYYATKTLSDEKYADFIKELKRKGFEIALHGVRGGSSEREVVQQGLKKYKEVLQEFPSIHVNHAQNKDNLYWGLERQYKFLRRIRNYEDYGTGYGHLEKDAHFWGDLALEHIKYIRGVVFNGINTLKLDPFMPYHEKRFPYANAWFSSSNGDDVYHFNHLINPENQQQLEDEEGLCIVYTHFGDPTFVKDGRVNQELERLLRMLASRNGWFVPVGEILRYISKDKVNQLSYWNKIQLYLNQRKDRVNAFRTP